MALLSAYGKGYWFKVRQLIKEDCDVNTRSDEFGTTPLMEAAWGGHDQVVENLIREGADVNGKSAVQ